MKSDFSGRSAIVTGGASGIGRATATALVERGARVVIADVDDRGREVAESLGTDALFVLCDVTDEEQVASLVAMAVSTFGGVDLAVNNAGIEGPRALIADCEEAAWRRVMDVDLVSVFLCLKHEMRAMRTQGRGAIVNTASIFGTVAATRASAYIAAKHGVIGLTKAAALEGTPAGIRVNAVAPGYIETPMVMEREMSAGSKPDVMQAIVAKQPSGRIGKPEEVANAIVWLLSDEAAYVNGHTLFVDGAYVAR